MSGVNAHVRNGGEKRKGKGGENDERKEEGDSKKSLGWKREKERGEVGRDLSRYDENHQYSRIGCTFFTKSFT